MHELDFCLSYSYPIKRATASDKRIAFSLEMRSEGDLNFLAQATFFFLQIKFKYFIQLLLR